MEIINDRKMNQSLIATALGTITGIIKLAISNSAVTAIALAFATGFMAYIGQWIAKTIINLIKPKLKKYYERFKSFFTKNIATTSSNKRKGNKNN